MEDLWSICRYRDKRMPGSGGRIAILDFGRQRESPESPVNRLLHQAIEFLTAPDSFFKRKGALRFRKAPSGSPWLSKKIKPARPSRAGDKRAGSFRGHFCTLRCKSGYSCTHRPEKAEKRNRLNTGRLMSGIRIARNIPGATLRLDVPLNPPTFHCRDPVQKNPAP